MANIFDLELKNLSKKEKKYWLEYFTAFDSDRMKETERWVAWSESVKKSKNRDLTEKTLGKHFADNRDLFFHFQNHHKNSLYNQALKKHGFKKLNYKDMVENLTPTQKEKIIDEIFDQARFLKVKCQEECDSYYDNDGFNYYYDYDAPYVKEITDENRDNFKDNENYKNSKYVLVKPNINVKSQAEFEFFKDDDELILFGLRKHEIGTGLLSWNKEILIPNYQINQWIVKNHELELIKKDSLGQTDELNEPKMKM